jgi:hypothetical protein
LYQVAKSIRAVKTQRALYAEIVANNMDYCSYIPLSGPIPAKHFAEDGCSIVSHDGKTSPACRECHVKNHRAVVRSQKYLQTKYG